MADLVVNRADDTAGAARRVRVHVDGAVVARLRPGEIRVVPLGPGTHEVQAKLDWTTSPVLAVDVPAEGRVEVEVSMPWSALWRTFVTPRRALVARIPGQG